MASDEEQKSKNSFEIGLGPQVDAALGDVIRGLLVKPSTELGNLLADGIGFFADRMRSRRLANTQIGLDDARQMLEARSVPLKDITPPAEEELYLVLENMSLAGDEQLRKLWSGLLAVALDPNDPTSIERPLMSAISSLSPADARVIQYAAFVLNTENAIKREAMLAAGLENERAWTVGDANRVAEARRGMGSRLAGFMGEAARLEESFGLENIATVAGWNDNLVRLGIIRPKSDSYKPSTTKFFGFRGEVGDGKFEAVIEHLERRIEEAEGLALDGLGVGFMFKRDEQEQTISLGFEFTSFGKKLCTACGIT
jgi:hypothetical protein